MAVASPVMKALPTDLGVIAAPDTLPQEPPKGLSLPEVERKDISPEMFELLEHYSRLAPDQVVPHVKEIRDRAFKIYQYPCIGLLSFLNPALPMHPLYPDVLARIKTQSHTLLDFGCCFGQDLRRAVHDGAPSSLLYGLDVEAAFIDMGYDLFQDKAELESTFVTGDIFSSNTEWSAPLEGKVDIINANDFLHLFTYSDQLAAGKRMVSFLRPVSGSLILGRQLGSTKPGEHKHPMLKVTTFRHGVESFTKLWEDVGAETGTRWRVEAQLDEVDFGGMNNSEPDMRRLRFAVFRE